jgi:hypothetical protein
MEKRFSRFSVPLGLLDYINPILYSITMVTITRKLFYVMGHPGNVIFLIGAIISVFFGLIIPTGKVLVGLGVIKFRMPVSLVFSVNTGILISGVMLLTFVMDLQPVFLVLLTLGIVAVLVLMYKKKRKSQYDCCSYRSCGVSAPLYFINYFVHPKTGCAADYHVRNRDSSVRHAMRNRN